MPVPQAIRLTQMTKSAGCAAKLGKNVLSDTLAALPKFFDPRLLVGFDKADDACVYKIRDDLAVIMTVDFFPPVVDDAYLYGQIAAANALSDIYAMGGEPSVALNLLCVPKSLPKDIVSAILEGGQSKAAEAGAVIAGGHSIEDSEPKYGLCVSGFSHPDEIWSNSGAKAGDLLVLTKPLGTGIATTAAKVDMISPESFKAAADSMAVLNKNARNAARRLGVHACTDVTGFGLIGHSCEMADAGGVTLEIDADSLEFFPDVIKLAEKGLIPGGTYRNREYGENRILTRSNIPPAVMDLLFDPQTSGGLLLSLPEPDARELAGSLPNARIIGRVAPYSGAPVVIM